MDKLGESWYQPKPTLFSLRWSDEVGHATAYCPVGGRADIKKQTKELLQYSKISY